MISATSQNEAAREYVTRISTLFFSIISPAIWAPDKQIRIFLYEIFNFLETLQFGMSMTPGSQEKVKTSQQKNSTV